MREAPEGKIITIIPADGWYARYDVDGVMEDMPLVCWALVEASDGVRAVHGMDGGDYVDFAEGISNFIAFVHKLDVKDQNQENPTTK